MKKINFLIVLSVTLTISGCDDDGWGDRNFRQDMREFVIGISEYTKATKPNFVVIPQNGIEIITVDGESSGALSTEYLNAIDGHGQEDLFFGYISDNVETPVEEIVYLQPFLDISKANGNVILVTDYCITETKVNSSYYFNNSKGYIGFAAPRRELDAIPNYPLVPNNVNSDNITQLSQVKNFLYLINPEGFATKAQFITAVTSTNYDLLIMDLFFNELGEFTASEVEELKSKANGGSRMVVCYMSIGEAEDYRYYWQSSWNDDEPNWLVEENPDWEGNFKVKYWETDWQNIIYGNDNSYAKKILNAGFDGVYLDIIEAFEYFEEY
jgi:cysteinyl-tRNA synthetase, unknown class